VSQIAQTHATLDASETTAIGFLDLIIPQDEGDLPTGFTGCHIGDPLTEMGGEGIEIEVEAVTGEDGHTAWSQNEGDRMEQGIGHELSAWAELESGEEFGGRVTGDPHLQVVGLVVQGGEEFVQLEMAKDQVLEKVGMNLLGVFPARVSQLDAIRAPFAVPD
jgi:hypothetical protein